MDSNNVVNKDLEEFILKTVVFEMPLYHNNPGKSVKLDFEGLSDQETIEVIRRVLCFLFEGDAIWICEWGANSTDTVIEKNLIYGEPGRTICIPYGFREDDYYVYENDKIVCIHTPFDCFNMSAYIEYVLETNFISNLLCLVCVPTQTAVHIYDRRGMDIVSTDIKQLMNLQCAFGKFFSTEW